MQHLSLIIKGSLVALAGGYVFAPASASAQSGTATTYTSPTPPVYYEQPPPPPPTMHPKPKLDRVQVGANVGWLFGANVDTSAGDVGLNGNWAYTGNLDVRVVPTVLVEGRYTYFPTKVEYHPVVGADTDVTDVKVHYFQGGLQSELPLPVARPFLGISAGATYINPTGNAVDVDGETYFATALSGGVKFPAGKNAGARLQASLPYTWTGTDSTVFCGLGGCSYGYIGDGILQLDLSAGAYAAF